MLKSPKVRVGVLVVLLVGVIAGGVIFKAHRSSQTQKFCNASLPFRTLDGEHVAYQDRDLLGPGCDGAAVNAGMDTLGMDCKVRSPGGSVVKTVKSSRADGTCGWNSPPG